jgi:hypothetical protein
MTLPTSCWPLPRKTPGRHPRSPQSARPEGDTITARHRSQHPSNESDGQKSPRKATRSSADANQAFGPFASDPLQKCGVQSKSSTKGSGYRKHIHWTDNGTEDPPDRMACSATPNWEATTSGINFDTRSMTPFSSAEVNRSAHCFRTKRRPSDRAAPTRIAIPMLVFKASRARPGLLAPSSLLTRTLQENGDFRPRLRSSIGTVQFNCCRTSWTACILASREDDWLLQTSQTGVQCDNANEREPKPECLTNFGKLDLLRLNKRDVRLSLPSSEGQTQFRAE